MTRERKEIVANLMCKYPDPSTNRRSHVYPKRGPPKVTRKIRRLLSRDPVKEHVLFALGCKRAVRARTFCVVEMETDAFKHKSSVLADKTGNITRTPEMR